MSGSDVANVHTSRGARPTSADSLHRLPRALALATLVTSLLVLAGWAFGVQGLRVLIGQVTVKPNTAFALALAALAVVLHDLAARRARLQVVAQLLGAATAAIGVATVAQYVLAVDLGIDQLLFRVSGADATSRTP